MPMRRMIDTLFLNNMARQWAQQDQQKKELADASLYAADRSKGLFDERANLAREQGATDFGAGRPLPEGGDFEQYGQLGHEGAQQSAEAAQQAAMLKQLMAEYKQKMLTGREMLKGQFGLQERGMQEEGLGERLGITEGGRQGRFDALAPLRQAKEQDLGAHSRYLNRMPQERAGGAGTAKLSPVVQSAIKGLEKVAQAASSLRTRTAGWAPVEMAAAQKELLNAIVGQMGLYMAQATPEERQQISEVYAPVIQSLRGGGGQTSILPQAPIQGPQADIAEPNMPVNLDEFQEFLK